MAGVPAGGGAVASGAGLVPPVPFFAGAAGRATGGAPGAEGTFLPASALGGVAVLDGGPPGAAGFFPVGPRGYPAVPPVPFFAGAAGRVAGGVPGPKVEFLPASVLAGVAVFGGTVTGTAGRATGGEPGVEGEFFPVSALDGAGALGGAGPGAAGFFPGVGTVPTAPEFPSLVKSAGLVPGGLSPYVCFCSWPNA
jgi:hypothetical protein